MSKMLIRSMSEGRVKVLDLLSGIARRALAGCAAGVLQSIARSIRSQKVLKAPNAAIARIPAEIWAH